MKTLVFWMQLAIIVLSSGGVFAQSPRQYYTNWRWQREENRFIADYYFKLNPTDQSYKKQAIVHYPSGDKKQYTYFYNYEKNKFWGRCVTRHHRQFDGNEMVWNFAHDAPPGANWGPLSKGNPLIPGLTPGGNDQTKMSMPPRVPVPPFN